MRNTNNCAERAVDTTKARMLYCQITAFYITSTAVINDEITRHRDLCDEVTQHRDLCDEVTRTAVTVNYDATMTQRQRLGTQREREDKTSRI